MKKFAFSAVISLVLIYLGLGTFLVFKQNSFLYFPRDAVPHSFPEVDFESGGETIKTIVVNRGQAHAVIYFGGNAERVISQAEALGASLSDRSIYLVNYRGYGGSSGEPSEEGLYRDALHIYDAIVDQHKSVSVIGRSLGSGVATYLAAERSVRKLVLVTPFDSIQAIAQQRFPIYPMSLLLRDKYDSKSRAGEIESDLLVLVADSDRVVPRVHTESLLSAFTNTTVKVELVVGSNHGTIVGADHFYQSVSEFMRNNIE